MPAVLFGSIGTIADTSELQREAFNEAFAAHGLPWRWEQEEYRTLLEQGGGERRIESYARATGQTVDAKAVHRSKSEAFQRKLGEAGLAPRAGVVESIAEARDQGVKVALVTTTSEANVAALIGALEPEVRAKDFDLVVLASDVEKSKPDPAAYRYALKTLGVASADCVAVEDNLDGVASARAAGLRCIAFPGANTAAHDFATADQRVDTLGFADLRAAIPGA